MKEKDLSILTNFEFPLYALEGRQMNYRPDVLSKLCALIKESKNHECVRCMKRQIMTKSTSKHQEEDRDSDEALIIEE